MAAHQAPSSLGLTLQARTLEWVAISFSNEWKWKVKVKSLSCIQLLETPWTAAHQAPPSMGFSRQVYCYLKQSERLNWTANKLSTQDSSKMPSSERGLVNVGYSSTVQTSAPVVESLSISWTNCALSDLGFANDFCLKEKRRIVKRCVVVVVVVVV